MDKGKWMQTAWLLVMLVSLIGFAGCESEEEARARRWKAEKKALDSLATNSEGKIDYFSKVVERDQNDFYAWFQLGLAQYDLKQWEGAEKSFSEYIRLVPDHWPAYLNRASCRRELGKLPEAVEDCNVAMDLAPENAEAYLARAELLEMLGAMDAAREDLELATATVDAGAYVYEEKAAFLLRRADTAAACQDLVIAAQMGSVPATQLHKKICAGKGFLLDTLR